MEYAEEAEARGSASAAAYPHPFNMVRKMACSFGWDWGPDLQTAGIWKPVRLERWRTARLAAGPPAGDGGHDGTGRVDVQVDDRDAGLPTTAAHRRVAVGSRRDASIEPAAAGEADVRSRCPTSTCGGPPGYGDQPLYDARGDPLDGDGERPLDR